MRTRKCEKGHVAVVVAGLLVVLLGFTSLAVDMGVFYTSRTAAQRAVDAAALAGAFTFVINPAAPQPATAQQNALGVATAQQTLGQPIDPADVTISVDVPNRLVTVNLTYDEGTYFARALGIDQVTIGVQGIAEASPNATGSSCTKPWFIPNTVFSALPPCQACAAMPPQVLVANNEVTAYGLAQLGKQYRVRSQKPGTGQLAPGQFYAIQIPGSSGGNDYRHNIATCVTAPLVCEQGYSVETGNMAGPTRQGVSDLMGPSPDVWDGIVQGIARYRRADGTLTDTSRQLIVAPVWDVCGVAGFCPTGDFPTGTNVNVSIVGFALVFLEGIQGNDVLARFINAAGCAGPLITNEAAPYSIPVRLVRGP